MTSSSLNMHDFKRVSEPELEQLLGIERAGNINYIITLRLSDLLVTGELALIPSIEKIPTTTSSSGKPLFLLY